MDKAFLLKQEGMYLSACDALFRREYLITAHGYALTSIYLWFSAVVKNCVFSDAHVFKVVDFEFPEDTFEKLQDQNSPFCGLYLFLVGCMTESIEAICDSYTIFKYKYAVLFMESTPIRLEETLCELANAGCGAAHYIMFARSNYENLTSLNKALIGNSHDAIIHLIDKEQNQKVR